jgi:hypothetical protein
MAPTLVNVALGVLLGVALLGAAFDRRSIVLVAFAAAVPDLDALVWFFGLGAANATLHSLFVPLGVAGLLYYDTAVRGTSWLRARYGWYGVRVAWILVAVYAVAGIGPDAFSTESVALLYPLSERYYAITGGFLFSTQDGIVQTYVAFNGGWIELATPGTVETYHLDAWIGSTGGERRFHLVETGWQAVLVVTAAVAAPAKGLVERHDRAATGGR